MENPYEWDDEQLLREFANACGRAGVSNSGLVISFCAGDDNTRKAYLWTVLEARLAGVKPPFSPGQQIKPTGKKTAPSPIGNGFGPQLSRSLPTILTVASIWYYNGRWDIQLKELDESTARWDDNGERRWLVPLRFRAEDFEVLVPATT